MENEKLKFKGHGTFFVRKGWLGKGLKAREKNDQIFLPSKIEEAMDDLGLGKNMVSSLRYWLNSFGLIVEKGKGVDRFAELTPIGESILTNDPYVEEIGTIWALHCILACQKSQATSWYWLFNEYGTGTFSRDEFIDGVAKFVTTVGGETGGKSTIARSSLESDFECILNTYISHERRTGKKVSPESVIDCPLGELGLIEIDALKDGRYRKRQPNLVALPNLIVLFSIKRALELEGPHGEKLKSYPAGMSSSYEIPLDDLLNEGYFPGRLLNLDSVALLSKLYELENEGYVRINRTAGSDMVRIDDVLTSVECLEKYYSLIG